MNMFQNVKKINQEARTCQPIEPKSNILCEIAKELKGTCVRNCKEKEEDITE